MKHKQNSILPKEENEMLDSELVAWWVKTVKEFYGGKLNKTAKHLIVAGVVLAMTAVKEEKEKALNEVKRIIDLMWDKDETDKNRYSVGWNSALTELLARLEVKSTAKGE